MNVLQPSLVHLENACASLSIDLNGGAITDFHLKKGSINPLTFRFSKEQMPDNNKNGAPFQGHFICAPRWGEPSEEERKKGLPDHGEPANMMWTATKQDSNFISMQARSKAEGLQIDRNIEIFEHVFRVTETVTNITNHTRMINIVQHPTIAAPFLDADTRIFCNATEGYHYESFRDPAKMRSVWPMSMYPDNTAADISFSHSGKTAVHSFAVDPADKYGWLVAYSFQHELLFGYIWERIEYPWINLWCDYHNGRILYRGLEFGTTGMHQPFDVMLQGATIIFGQPVFEVLDAGSMFTKRYHCFLEENPGSFTDILSVDFNEKKMPVVNFVR